MNTAPAGSGEPGPRRFRFGDFVLDLDRGALRRGREEIKLRPRAFEVLAYLVERRGKLVTKNELVAAVWAGLVVTDNSLAQCLVEIRRAIDDDRQETIRTVARRGYLFAAPIVSLPPEEDAPAPFGLAWAGTRSRRTALIVAALAAVVAAAWLIERVIAPTPPQAPLVPPIQLTDFTDAAVAPALSPDGRMLAFIRGQRELFSPDQI